MLSIILFVFQFLIVLVHSGHILKLDDVWPRKEQDVGQRFQMVCSVLDGDRPIEFQWSRDNVPLKSKPNMIVETNAAETRLIIPNVTPEDAGKFSCRAKNAHSDDSKVTMLIVKGLSCLYFVFQTMWGARVTLIFKFRQQNYLRSFCLFVCVLVLLLLLLSAFTMLSIIFFAFQLMIHVQAENVLKLDDVFTRKELNVGRRFQMTCLVLEGAKPIEFQWYRDNVPLKPKHNVVIEKNDIETKLIIPKVSSDDAANYSCHARAGRNFDTKATVLIINGSYVTSFRCCLLLRRHEAHQLSRGQYFVVKISVNLFSFFIVCVVVCVHNVVDRILCASIDNCCQLW